MHECADAWQSEHDALAATVTEQQATIEALTAERDALKESADFFISHVTLLDMMADNAAFRCLLCDAALGEDHRSDCPVTVSRRELRRRAALAQRERDADGE
jgi:hypothetical protein